MSREKGERQDKEREKENVHGEAVFGSDRDFRGEQLSNEELELQDRERETKLRKLHKILTVNWCSKAIETPQASS